MKNKADTRDFLIQIIKRQYDLKYEKEGYVSRSFFECNSLRNYCEESLRSFFQILKKEYNLSNADFNELFTSAIADVRYSHPTVIAPSLSLNAQRPSSWLTDEIINKLGWNNSSPETYRVRYLQYLKKIGRPETVIKETDRSSLEIIRKVGNPLADEDFFVKGLVVGSVQSGKTANFNAVINSAIDVGYKLIIVFSGLMEDLRKQTQTRTEKEVEGKMIRQDCFIGVGEIASFGFMGKYRDINSVNVITSIKSDFNRSMLYQDFTLNNINLLICKKNTSVLKNLLVWLRENLSDDIELHNTPLLIVDDEADNASLNNQGHKGKEYANAINGHIRATLAMFRKKTYIGYTATPFANILQDFNKEPEGPWLIKNPNVNNNNEFFRFKQVGNLFPEQFIELLNPPSNYIGPKSFFETRIDEVIKIEPLIAPPIEDYYENYPDRVEKYESGEIVPVKKYDTVKEFESDPEAITRFVNFQNYRSTTRAAKKDDGFPKELPESLKEAVGCFIISIAVRLFRYKKMRYSNLYNRHHSMLLHVSRFTNWQSKTKTLVKNYVDEVSERIANDKLDHPDSVFKEFERLWVKFFAYAITTITDFLPENYSDEHLEPIQFEQVRNYLNESIKNIDVKAINTSDKDVLDYEEGDKKYIVIGGNRLSRGFTLEGLTINYFIRNTNYADTLMQMGRWFGYRPGYLDCCKLFTNQKTINMFNLITWTIEELEEDFKRMSRRNKSPEDYALKVLNHPNYFKITRPSILRNANEIQWSFSDRLIQTTEFKITRDTINKSWNNFKKLCESNKNKFEEPSQHGFLVLKTNLDVVESFINSQETHTKDFEKEGLIKFLRKCADEYNLLKNWTIAVNTNGEGSSLTPDKSGLISEIKLSKRSSSKNEENIYYRKLETDNIFRASGRSANIVTSAKDLSVVLSPEEINQAQRDFLANNPGKNFPEWIYRERIDPNNGLMLVYLMDLNYVFPSGGLREKARREAIDLNIPLVGFAFGIPPLNDDLRKNYLINANIKSDDDESDYTEDEIEGIIT